MGEIAIGIDLGTSNSCVSHAEGKDVEVLPNAYGENITASVVSFHEDGAVTVGNSAKANLIHSPQSTVASAKRLIGRYFFSEEVKKAQAICAYDIVEGPGHGVRVVIRDEEFSLPEISAMILREMKSVSEERLGEPVTKAVITVPAYFNDNQRQATKDAGRIAGLEVLRLLNEPTAAALAYGFGRGLNQTVAVYDLGGGTFDISILEIGTDVFEVLATCGDTYLGGDDFDDRVIDLLADEFMASNGINLRKDMYALEKLKLAAENAKRGLSLEDEVEIRIPDVAKDANGEPLALERSLTIQDFSALVNDLILRTFKVCDEALQQANLTTRDLEGVILVGGPTRLGIIRDAVSMYFGQEPKTDVDPDEVVAMGAAIHAASLVAEEPSDDDAFLLDVTPLSLKIGVAGGLAENVIERNTPVPIEQTRTFTTYQDNQESVRIRVFQGESRQADGNEMLGQFEFSGFEPKPRGQTRIDVTFEIDADGILSVTAGDQETGRQASTTITLNSGLSDDELDNIVGEGRADRVQTASNDDVAAPAPVPPIVAPDAGDDLDDLVGDDDLDDLVGMDDLVAMDGLEDEAEVAGQEAEVAGQEAEVGGQEAEVALPVEIDSQTEIDDLDDFLESEDTLTDEPTTSEPETSPLGLAAPVSTTPPVLSPPAPPDEAGVPELEVADPVEVAGQAAVEPAIETASAAEILDDLAAEPHAPANEALDLPDFDDLDEMVVESEDDNEDTLSQKAAPDIDEGFLEAQAPESVSEADEVIIELEAEAVTGVEAEPMVDLSVEATTAAAGSLFERDEVDLTDYGSEEPRD
jgi:molecular chaperone DnaK